MCTCHTCRLPTYPCQPTPNVTVCPCHTLNITCMPIIPTHCPVPSVPNHTDHLHHVCLSLSTSTGYNLPSWAGIHQEQKCQLCSECHRRRMQWQRCAQGTYPHPEPGLDPLKPPQLTSTIWEFLSISDCSFSFSSAARELQEVQTGPALDKHQRRTYRAWLGVPQGKVSRMSAE